MLAILAVLDCSKAASVSLGWSASSDPDVMGYNIYYGTASGDYTSEVTVGNVAEVTISNLTPGVTYYFAATAFDTNGNESTFSDETAYLVPAVAALAPGTLALSQGSSPGDPMVIQFPVEPGHWYEVQASVDMQTWSTISQTDAAITNDVVQFSDTNSSSFPSRFYRLVLH